MTELAQRLTAARRETDALFDLLDPVALYERPVAERHRLIFYLGHLEAFDWNLVGRGELSKPAFNATLDKLFAFGIDPEPGGAPIDTPADWPSEPQVRDYVRRVRREFDGAMSQVPEQLLHVAIEHRLMHAETLAYLFHNLPSVRKRGPVPAGSGDRPAPENSFLEVPAGDTAMGLSRGAAFGWDNEFERQVVSEPAFRITRYKISNGEYLEYMRATAAPAPNFWLRREGHWFLRAMFGEIPLPLDWPVYVTHTQAEAYAQWRGGTLPSEPQFHRAAEGSEPVNADFNRWDPVPVDFGNGGPHPAQLIGNGWEWTSTVFGPFPGFERFPFYPGYSADFFDGKHFVMKGGSARTAACLLRPSFRNWFRGDYPYAYAGFRVAQASRMEKP